MRVNRADKLSIEKGTDRGDRHQAAQADSGIGWQLIAVFVFLLMVVVFLVGLI
jgi:hypothetical protein